jgi:hypothetical protein
MLFIPEFFDLLKVRQIQESTKMFRFQKLNGTQQNLFLKNNRKVKSRT